MTARAADTPLTPPNDSGTNATAKRMSNPRVGISPAVFTASVWLGATPPSLNAISGPRAGWKWAKAKAAWQRDLGLLLMAEQLPRGLSRVEATAVLSFPTERRRDTGNFRSLLEKALGDALVEGRWLADDTPDQYDFGALEFTRGPSRTVVNLSCSLPEPWQPPVAATPPTDAEVLAKAGGICHRCEGRSDDLVVVETPPLLKRRAECGVRALCDARIRFQMRSRP